MDVPSARMCLRMRMKNKMSKNKEGRSSVSLIETTIPTNNEENYSYVSTGRIILRQHDLMYG